jgi:hypothetical protein
LKEEVANKEKKPTSPRRLRMWINRFEFQEPSDTHPF